jgi:NAD(P)H-hydrate epimerase
LLIMPSVENSVYTASQVRDLDQLAIQDAGIPAYTLMSRAGQATFERICERWSVARSLCILCGGGNNGGDGYIVARLALQAGWQVSTFSLTDVLRLQGAAQQAYEDFVAAGGRVQAFDGVIPAADVLLDAMLGTGLDRAVEGVYATAIDALDQHTSPVVAVDIPSGLHADTGQACGMAVQADMTVTFIGLKAGLLTGKARDYCGILHFARLDVPDSVYAQVPTDMNLLGEHTQRACLPPRSRSAHKGQCGHALLVGGAPGMSGAVRLAGEAALRVGSGLVSVATHPEHAPTLNLFRPELMVAAVESPVHLRSLLPKMAAIGIGPGMGQTAWARGLLTMVQTAPQPKVLDADALGLLAHTPLRRDDWVLTPHPGEAARLLGCETWAVEQDRVAAARQLQAKYGGVIVLKGAGTLVASAARVAFCPAGNPGMASGGMGDALTGIITGLLAQGLDTVAAAEVGVWVHARAADMGASSGERGLLASDVIACLREAMNI